MNIEDFIDCFILARTIRFLCELSSSMNIRNRDAFCGRQHILEKPQ